MSRSLFLIALLLVAVDIKAVDIKTISAAASLASSSGSIVKEAHDMFTHPWRTLKKHGADMKQAAKGKPAPPTPFPVSTPTASPVVVPSTQQEK